MTYWITATKNGHLVSDLQKEDLQLWIGKQKQSISILAFNPPQPLKVGLLFDISASQRSHWPGAEISLASGLLRQVILPGDQAFIICFNDKIFINTELTSDLGALDQGLQRLATMHPRGGTALYTAIAAACRYREADLPAHPVLVVMTDGRDDASRIPYDQAIAMLRSRDTTLDIIGIGVDTDSRSPSVLRSAIALASMAGATGGRAFLTSNQRQLESGFNSLAEALRAEYALEFQPAGVSPGKEGNRIKIKCFASGSGYSRTRELLSN